MTKAERQDLDLRIYLTSTNVSHISPLQQSIGHLVDRIFTAQDVTSVVEHTFLDELARNERNIHKAGLDYAYALQACHENSASPYIAILEDDVLLADGWLARTRLAVREIEERVGERWQDLRLFNQTRSLGWGSRRILSKDALILITIICAIIVGGTFLHKRYGRRRVLAIPTIIVLCFATVPSFVILFFQAGKASILPPRPGISVQTWGPCVQGNVFARNHLPGLIQAIRENAAHRPHDLILRDYAAWRGLTRYVLTPSQIQHMGFESVVSVSRPRAEFPWSVAYEDLQAEHLAAEHVEMVRQVYNIGQT